MTRREKAAYIAGGLAMFVRYNPEVVIPGERRLQSIFRYVQGETCNLSVVDPHPDWDMLLDLIEKKLSEGASPSSPPSDTK